METVKTATQLRARLADWRHQGLSIGLVPTMGNLHAGHLALVEQARRHCQRVVVSIFVNPSQFGVGEDFLSYPRTPEQDSTALQTVATDLLFLPAVETLYPPQSHARAFVEVPGLSDELCGAFRPGHFRGVATVVCKLFNLVQPDAAWFGEKDYQQLAVIRRMVADLDLPVRVEGIPTVREADGLAMSSRNGYLSADERELAPTLYRTLQAAAAALRAGERDFIGLEQRFSQVLREAGFQPDYFAIRCAADLAPPNTQEHQLVILSAARLGRTRLIDNLSCDLS